MKRLFGGKGRFWHSKGVYGMLAVVLLAIGAAGVAMASRTLFHSEPEEPSRPITEPVEQLVSDQPDDRPTTTTTTETAPITTTTTVEEAPDLYILPLSNTVQKRFSMDRLLYSETMGDWRTHSGTDFAGEEGQPVKALAGGSVVSAEESPLWGWILTIDHGVEVVSRYYGVTPTVAVGDTVEVGAVIGNLAGIPCESAQSPHLHLEITIDGVLVDPVTALAKEVRYAEDTTTAETTAQP